MTINGQQFLHLRSGKEWSRRTRRRGDDAVLYRFIGWMWQFIVAFATRIVGLVTLRVFSAGSEVAAAGRLTVAGLA